MTHSINTDDVLDIFQKGSYLNYVIADRGGLSNVSNLSIGEDPNISNFYLQAGLEDKVCLEMCSKASRCIKSAASVHLGAFGMVHLGAVYTWEHPSRAHLLQDR